MTAPYNPYLGLPYAELCGRRKDYAKLLHAAVAARKAAERQLTLIVEAMEGADEARPYEASDHAVVRYLERVWGMDVSALREEIAMVCENAEPLIGDKMRGADGHLYCVNNDGFITTVLPLDAVTNEAAESERVKGERLRPNAQVRRGRRALRGFLASAMSAGTAETEGLGAKPASAVGNADAPKERAVDRDKG